MYELHAALWQADQGRSGSKALPESKPVFSAFTISLLYHTDTAPRLTPIPHIME